MAELLPLFGLALVDSLSVGTLVIPVALIIMWRKVRWNLYGVYLGAIALAYLALGVTLLFGIDAIVGAVGTVTRANWFGWVTLLLGVALAAYGILAPNPKKVQAADKVDASVGPVRVSDGVGTGSADHVHTAVIAEAQAVPSKGQRMARAASTTVAGMLGLAVTAAIIEAATMLPYLAAIGIVQTAEASLAAKIGIMAVYCLVMIAPASVVGVLAAAAKQKVFGRLERIMHRLEYEAKVTLLWIAAIVGVYMAASSAVKLGLIG